MPGTPKPVEPRFLKFTNKSPGLGPNGECWEWKGFIGNNGYGRIAINNRKTEAHRASYELYIGPIAKGLIVRHTCDNRICVNPAHLIIGTQKENMADKASRGRCNNGNNGKALCKRGHPFSAENTYLKKDGNRACRACFNLMPSQIKRKSRPLAAPSVPAAPATV